MLTSVRHSNCQQKHRPRPGLWLAEANAIVDDWLKHGTERLLSTTTAARLADRIARELQRAFERGRGQRHA